MPPENGFAAELLKEIRDSRAQHSAEIADLRQALHAHEIAHAADRAAATKRLDELEGGHARHRDEHKAIVARAFLILLGIVGTLALALASLWSSLHP